MLVLTDTDCFGLDFHQFGQRIYEPPAYGDCASHCGIFIGKLAASNIRRGINRRPRFIDHNDRDIQIEAAQEGLRLSACGAVADRNHLDSIPFADFLHFSCCLFSSFLGIVGKDHMALLQPAQAVDHCQLAAGSKTWIYCQDALLTQGRV